MAACAQLGLILNNYASSDTLALLARGGMLASIVFGFPLVFSGRFYVLIPGFGVQTETCVISMS